LPTFYTHTSSAIQTRHS